MKILYGDYRDDDPLGLGFEGPADRAWAKRNPRNLPCPTCGEPNRLTRADVRRRYQCDECADRAEGFGG